MQCSDKGEKENPEIQKNHEAERTMNKIQCRK